MASVFARSLATAARRATTSASRMQLQRAPLAVRSVARAGGAIPTPARRAFSTPPAAGAEGSTGDATPTSPAVDSLDENRFLELAEEMLNEIQTWIDGIEEMLEESDVSLSQGVLKIDLGEHGTWVLNRQVPNRQIWWSSPISGPRRYELDATSGKWLNTRDKTELFERLQDEIADATGISIFQ